MRTLKIISFIFIFAALSFCAAAYAYDPYWPATTDGGDTGYTTVYSSKNGNVIGIFYNGVKFWYDGDKYPDKNGWIYGEFQCRYGEASLNGWMRKENVHKYDVMPGDEPILPVGTVIADAVIETDENNFCICEDSKIYIAGEGTEKYFVFIAGTMANGWIDKGFVNVSDQCEAVDTEPAKLSEAVLYGHSDIPVYLYSDITAAEYEKEAGESVEVVWRGEQWSMVKFVKDFYGTREWNCKFIESRFLDEAGDHTIAEDTYEVFQVIPESSESYVQVRENPKNNAKVKYRLYRGAPVKVKDYVGDWAEIFLDKNTGGYIKTKCLTKSCEDETVCAFTTAKIWIAVKDGNDVNLEKGTLVTIIGCRDDDVVYTADGKDIRIGRITLFTPVDPSKDKLAKVANTPNLMIREYPGKEYDVVSTIRKGNTLTVTIPGDTWCQIRYDDTYAYVMTKYLNFED